MSHATSTTIDTTTSPTNEVQALAADLYRLEFSTDLYERPRSVYTDRYEDRARRLLGAGWAHPEPRPRVAAALRTSRWPHSRRRARSFPRPVAG
jgi:hypothetical protein